MHLKDGFHDECQLPTLFNKSQQYHLLQILNEKQLFLDIGIFMDRLDLISKVDLQKFFYTNSKSFFKILDHKSRNENYLEELEKWWYSFFSPFNYATTTTELNVILSCFGHMVSHREQFDNKSSVMVKLKEYILENRPMFTAEKEEDK